MDDRIYWKELLSLKKAGFEVVHICVGNEDKNYVTTEAIQIIEIKKRTFFKNVWLNRIVQLVLWNKTTLYYIFEKAKSTKASIYHYHDFQLNALTRRLKKLPQSPKLIYDAHETYHLLFEEIKPNNTVLGALHKSYIFLSKKWEIKNAALADAIIATDLYTHSYFKRCLPKINGTILYNYSYYPTVSSKDVGEKKYDFIYTGLLSESRGVVDIIDAMALLKKEISATILFLGSFETKNFEEQVVRRIKLLRLQKNIIVHPPIPFNRISQYYLYSSIGLGVFHQTPKYSTFIPIKLFEYMAFGLPVIFSNHGPSAKIVEDSKCGLLVPGRNPKKIYESMIQLLSNKKLYKEYSNNGRKAVLEKYNWISQEKKLLKLYSNLLNTK